MNEQQILGMMIKVAIGGDAEKSKEVSAIISDNLKENCDTIGIPIGSISDGYHTFDELYEHRIELFIALAKAKFLEWMKIPSHLGVLNNPNPFWISARHSDNSPVFDGWFLAGLFYEKGKQITYHLPVRYWDKCEKNGALVFSHAPEWDGHASADVLKRLEKL